ALPRGAYELRVMINPDDVRGARSQSSGDRPWTAPKIEDRLTPRNWQSFEHGVPITPLILGLIFREQVHQLILTDSVPRSQTWRMSAPGPLPRRPALVRLPGAMRTWSRHRRSAAHDPQRPKTRPKSCAAQVLTWSPPSGIL